MGTRAAGAARAGGSGRVVAKPSMTGMLRSIRIRSKRSAALRATASAPSLTHTDVQPSAAEVTLRDGRVDGLVFDQQHVAAEGCIGCGAQRGAAVGRRGHAARGRQRLVEGDRAARV